MRNLSPWSLPLLMAMGLVIGAGTPLADEGADFLLSKARLWQSRHRPADARQALDQLQLSYPDHAEGLAERIRLEIAEGQIAQAQAFLARLRTHHPDYPQLKALTALVTLTASDPDQLRRTRMAYKSWETGRGQERLNLALQSYQELFTDGPPPGELAWEYWYLIMQVPERKSEALDQLRQIAEQDPDNPAFQLAWADLESRQPDGVPRALSRVRRLANDPAQQKAARLTWRNILLRLKHHPDNAPLLEEYLLLEPGDSALQELLGVMRGQPEATAEVPVVLSPEQDSARRMGEEGIALMRKSRHGDALPLFTRALELDPDNSEKWQTLIKAARYWSLLRQTDQAISTNKLTLAERKVTEAMRIDPEEPQGLAIMGQIAAKRNDIPGAEKWYRRALRKDPTNYSALNGLLTLMLESDQHERLLAALKALTPPQRRTLGTRVQALRAEMLQTTAKAMQQAGRLDEAQGYLEEARSLNPGDPWIGYRLARLLAERGQVARGRELLEAGQANYPRNVDWRYALALYLSAEDEKRQAIATLESIPAASRTAGMKELHQRLSLDLLIAEGLDLARADDHDQARERLQQATRQAGDVEELQEQVRKGWQTLDGIIRGDTPAGEDSQDPPPGNAVLALDVLTRDATPGKSSVEAIGVLAEGQIPLGPGGRLFIRAEELSFDAGSLDLDDPQEAETFGTLLLCGQWGNCPQGSLDQSATGLTLALGYQTPQLRFDLGTTPSGMEVQNLVGGLRWDGDVGPFSYGLTVSRRPLTSSLLTFGGTRDPGTGEVWGGILANGLRLNLSRDQGGTFGFWSNLSWHALTGENVPTNDRKILMGGFYGRVINEPDRELSLGINASYWSFERNLGEFTFGHGGYYSPQSYASLSFPVTWEARTQRWAYILRAGISFSWSRLDDAPYYPGHPDLQADAERLEPVTGVDPWYEGGSSHSTGYGIRGAFEYQITPHLFVGGSIGIDRSPFYEPNRGMLYLRYDFEAYGKPLARLPQTLTPYGDF